MKPTFDTIAYTDAAVVLLDQRALPGTETYLTCPDWQTVAAAITDMVVRGAPAIGITAAYGIALAARAHGADPKALDPGAIEPAFQGLAATRPTAVNLFWALDRMRARLAADPTLAALEAEARAIHDHDRDMCAAIGDHGAALLDPGTRILTHCNTGALATGGAGTALAVIRAAWRDDRLAHVYADETRPYLQGARLTAWELTRDAIPTTVIPDGAAAHLMATGHIDAVIVGADRIAQNGDVANKIGTYGLAILARHHHIPFYVAIPTTTLDLATPTGAEIPIEERPAREVTHVGPTRIVPERAAVRNPAFDITPAALVTAIITERGVLRPPYSDSLTDKA